jgi:alpha-1,6-mannosyltransferase
VLLGLLIAFGCLYVSVPAGFSPRLGEERDVTSLFPALWHWRPFLLPSDATAPDLFAGRARAIMCGLWLAYALAIAAVFRLREPESRAGLRIVVLLTILGHALLVLMPPVLSGDLFHYALFGRMVSHYGLNPYVTAAARLREDPLWPYASWNFLTTHYGPSFTWVSAATTWLSHGNVFWTAIGFKTLAALMSLASCWLIRDISARLGEGDGLKAFALYALNPLVLIETAGIGHNEAMVVAFALTGVSLALRGHPWVALVALLLSADVKNVTASVALFFAVRFIFQGEGARMRIRRAAGVLAVGVLVAVALWAPFWRGCATFATSWALINRGSGLRTGEPGQGISVLRLALFGVLVGGGAVWAARGSVSAALNLSAAVGLVFLIGVFPWAYAWYAIPSLALAAAARRSRANTLLLLLALAYGLACMQMYVRLHPS